jgi:hypothetical protein
MPPAQEGKGGRGQIGKREQRRELLRLPHVNALMRSRSLEAIRIAAEHDVPERHRVGMHGCHSQEQPTKPPVTSEDTGVRPCPPTGKDDKATAKSPKSVTGERRCHAIQVLENSILLLGRFRTAIPWLAKLSRRQSRTHCGQGWDRTPGPFMSELPYFAEDLIIRLRGTLLHKRPNLRMECVDLRVWVRPRIDERRFIKRAH